MWCGPGGGLNFRAFFLLPGQTKKNWPREQKLAKRRKIGQKRKNWPKEEMAKRRMAQRGIGQKRNWPKEELAKRGIGQKRNWPKEELAKRGNSLIFDPILANSGLWPDSGVEANFDPTGPTLAWFHKMSREWGRSP